MPQHTTAERAKNKIDLTKCPFGQHFDKAQGICVPDEVKQPPRKQTITTLPQPPDIQEFRTTFEKEQAKKAAAEKAQITKVQPPQAPAPLSEPNFIRGEDGEITGVIKRDGTVVLIGGGREKEDIIDVAEKDRLIQIPGVGEGREAAFQEALKDFTSEQQDKALELFERFQGNELTPEILATLDPGTINAYQVIASGVGGSAGAIGLRLAIGGAVGGPVGFAIAGIGIAVGSLANVKGQLKGIVKGKGALLIEFDQTMNDGINLVNGGFATQGVMLYNDAKQEIFKLREELKITESRHLAKLTGVDATKQLLRINGWIKITLPGSEERMRNALLNPDPTRVVKTTPISFED